MKDAPIDDDSGHRATVWSVTPAKAGVQSLAFAGMTSLVFWPACAPGRLQV